MEDSVINVRLSAEEDLTRIEAVGSSPVAVRVKVGPSVIPSPNGRPVGRGHESWLVKLPLGAVVESRGINGMWVIEEGY